MWFIIGMNLIRNCVGNVKHLSFLLIESGPGANHMQSSHVLSCTCSFNKLLHGAVHFWCSRCRHLVRLSENDIKRACFSRISNSFYKPIKDCTFKRRKMKDRSRSLKTLIFLSIIYDAFASTIGPKYNNPYPGK